jgi:coenzyme F420 hydrogenase subunit beta
VNQNVSTSANVMANIGSKVSDLLANQFCIGCGICAGICPTGHLAMNVSEYGFPKPHASQSICSNCSICLLACPFLDHEIDEEGLAAELYCYEKGIRHNLHIGFFLSGYVGHVADEAARLRSASGGLATWFLSQLLKEKRVDAVAHVVPRYGDSEVRFQFSLCHTPEEVAEGAGSKYYPVDAADIIHQILAGHERVALIGLPCLIKGLRLATRAMPNLSKQFPILLGLTCGRMKSRLFTEYLIRAANRNPTQCSAVRFRGKSPGITFSVLFQVFQDSTRDYETLWNFKRTPYGQIFCTDLFEMDACHACDDLYAEVADATFMDAWLPDYQQEWRGTSIVVLRTAEMKALIEYGIKRGELIMQPISEERIIHSQAPAINLKRDIMAHRLAWWDGQGKWHPRKRVSAVTITWRANLRLNWEDYHRRVVFKAMQAQHIASPSGLKVFHGHIRLVNYMDRLLHYAIRSWEWLDRMACALARCFVKREK